MRATPTWPAVAAPFSGSRSLGGLPLCIQTVQGVLASEGSIASMRRTARSSPFFAAREKACRTWASLASQAASTSDSRTGQAVFVASVLDESIGGEGGIRTHDTVAGIAVFETARFSHLRTSPRA